MNLSSMLCSLPFPHWEEAHIDLTALPTLKTLPEVSLTVPRSSLFNGTVRLVTVKRTAKLTKAGTIVLVRFAFPAKFGKSKPRGTVRLTSDSLCSLLCMLWENWRASNHYKSCKERRPSRRRGQLSFFSELLRAKENTSRVISTFTLPPLTEVARFLKFRN